MKKTLLCALCLTLFWCLPQWGGASVAETDDEYRNLEILTDVLSLINSSYVEDTDSRELIYGAINGMLSTLDPHSSFLTPEMYENMEADTHGEFGGLGIEIAIRDNMLIVVAPIEDTPAYRAGIKAGDRIVSIDGHSTTTLEIMKAVRLMRGPKGEPVTLEIQRLGEDSSLSFTIVRDIIQIKSVKSRLIDKRYGYLRILQFQDRTGSDLVEHIRQLETESDQPLLGYILDLRNNPGGLLDQAVAVSDIFLSEGLIVYTEGRNEQAQLKFQANDDKSDIEAPLVVLINGGSASASEIVAGALQDHGRALILGEQSFGKGSVQTIIPLGDDSGLRLTTSRYFTPSGRSIQARGITPDVHVVSTITPHGDAQAFVREEDLENHIQSSETDSVTKNAEATSQRQDDYQIQRALEHLRGYRILNRLNSQDNKQTD